MSYCYNLTYAMTPTRAAHKAKRIAEGHVSPYGRRPLARRKAAFQIVSRITMFAYTFPCEYWKSAAKRKTKGLKSYGFYAMS